WAVGSTPGSSVAARPKNSRTWAGFAIPVVSPNPTSSAPAAASRPAISKTRAGSTSPSSGQPKLVEIPPSQRRPSARARPSTFSTPVSDSSTVRFTLCLLWDSEAERKTLISSIRSRCASAASSPRSFGISTETETSSGIAARSSTSPASASCGITSARTKLVTSSQRSPVAASISISRTLSAVAMISGSFWNPSRGPTSRIFTARGVISGPERAGDHHLLHLVGALADRQDLGVAVEAADRVLLDEAVATVDLHRLLGRAHREAAALQLRLRRGEAEVAPFVLQHRRFEHQQPGRLDLGRDIGELRLDRLELGDRLAEGAPLLGVGERLVERPLGQPDAHRGNADAADVEYLEELAEAHPARPE